ncbi:MAG: methyltransferase [Candidatus Zophobacter franzmannii]|nr:methyltransferase [Candidatus Zophobacter franzmannii]
MKQFKITVSEETCTESYLEGEFEIVSRSGLNSAEKHLIDQLVFLKQPKRILITENRTAALGMIAHALYPDAEIYLHNIDKYYTDKIEINLSRNHIEGITIICEPDLPELKFDAVFVQCSRANAIKELYSDWVEQSFRVLKYKGKLVIGTESREVWLELHIKSIFGTLTYNNFKRNGTSLISRKTEEKDLELEPRDLFDCLIGEDILIQLSSRPGVFAHHRVDVGAYALMKCTSAKDGDKVFDMGCGIGTVGIGLAKKNKLSNICFVDSNARAIQSSKFNCQSNGIENAEFLLNAKGVKSVNNIYDVYVANPPYFSHYKIAELFVETGYRVLKKGGTAWLVARSADKLKELMKETFGNVDSVRYHGYEIVFSTK